MQPCTRKAWVNFNERKQADKMIVQVNYAADLTEVGGAARVEAKID